MKAMLFERLVHDRAFISELMTRGIGKLDLDRPSSVHHVECRRSPRRTVQALAKAHAVARDDGVATMLTGTSVPMAGFEGVDATPVLPDFIVIARRQDSAGDGSWLIAGDAKDYERIRSRIPDARLLKGFLQVALGAECFAEWSLLPEGMRVHPSGFLAVPRSAYLRPEVVVEELADHRGEVRGRLAQRRVASQEPAGAALAQLAEDRDGPVDPSLIAHIEAEFDPARCVTCSLFAFCRNRLRTSTNPADLLVEIGIPKPHRPLGEPLLDQPSLPSTLPEREALGIVATVTGLPQWTRAKRIDALGMPGTVNVVVVKSDSAALGVNGASVQRISVDGAGAWKSIVFTEPRTPETRSRLLGLIGEELSTAMVEADSDERPVHVCVPDRATADLLATMADSAAGVEISRLSWEHDVAQGREPLTFDGQPATIPDPLPVATRLAVSFLLDEDRARAFVLRHPVVVVQEVLARHLVPGGPWSDTGRLDYLVRWAEADTALEHRVVSDAVSDNIHAPGARMTTTRSNELHGAEQAKSWDTYKALVGEELRFRTATMDRAIAAIAKLPLSRMRAVHEAIERDAQAVWRRRLTFHASDLVRFSLTARFWRDNLVDPLAQDVACASALAAMLNVGNALDLARDAGNRSYVEAEVVSVSPLTLRSIARALEDGMEVVALHVNDTPEFERADVAMKVQKGSFAFEGVRAGAIESTGDPNTWLWHPADDGPFAIGDRVTLAVVSNLDHVAWLVHKGRQFNLTRPTPDAVLAPKPTCSPGDYDDDPSGHQWCCKPHEIAAAERADRNAERRARGEMNPDVWPPILDVERFPAPGDEDLDDGEETPDQPEGATWDDIE